ncbi:MAG TPA: hypothetical protein VFH67_05830 [bacterium]|nr:hypothetical protein [bacterium]
MTGSTMHPQLARAALRIGVFIALTSGVLTFIEPRGSPEKAISLWTLLAALLFLAVIVARMRRV